MSFTPQEIQFLGDLNFKARAELNHVGSLAARLLAFALKLKDGTYPSWPLDNEVLNAMAANEYGRNDPRSQPILDQLALVYRTSIDWNYRLPAPSVPPPSVPTVPLTPPPTPSTPVVAAPVPVTDEFTAQVIASLAKLNIHLRQNKIGVGIEPDADNPAALHIGGAAIASINGVSNVSGSDTQNPSQRHSNVFVVCDNDGGMRGVQYGHWFNGKVIRNTTNRRMSIFALFDSMGDTCINDDVGGHGQDFYIVRDTANRRVILGGYKPGLVLEIRETSAGAAYSAMDVKKL